MIITLFVITGIEFIMGRKTQLFIKYKLVKADWIIVPTLFISEAANKLELPLYNIN